MPLDPDDPRPTYVQVADVLRAAILDKQFGPGDKLPPRAELAKTYNVAPMTVQSALRELREEGLIVSRQGSGVFVRTRPVDAEPSLHAALHVLSEIHAPTGPDDPRCRECRDDQGHPVPWPCRTHREVVPLLTAR